MKLTIHARHADLAEDFSQIVEEKINSLERFSVLIERIEVEILHEANPRQGKHSHHIIILITCPAEHRVRVGRVSRELTRLARPARTCPAVGDRVWPIGPIIRARR